MILVLILLPLFALMIIGSNLRENHAEQIWSGEDNDQWN